MFLSLSLSPVDESTSICSPSLSLSLRPGFPCRRTSVQKAWSCRIGDENLQKKLSLFSLFVKSSGVFRRSSVGTSLVSLLWLLQIKFRIWIWNWHLEFDWLDNQGKLFELEAVDVFLCRSVDGLDG